MKRRFLVLNGPNLNWLGKREPALYGQVSYGALCKRIAEWAKKTEKDCACFQSNHEGVLIDRLQQAEENFDGVVFNPGALTHTSIALRDCVASLSIPVIEAHLTNIYRRELWRQHSFLSEVAAGSVIGFGIDSYFLGLELLA